MSTQFRSPFTVRRKSTGSYVNGTWVEGIEQELNINASVQAVTGKEMESLPEGRRSTQSVKIYANTKLNTVDDGNPDILEAFGKDFEITTVEPRQSNVINHYKCIGIKLET